MLVIQTRNAKLFRKSSIGFAIVFVFLAALGALLTMHWYVLPPKK
jgi:hypothetical protein